MGKLIDLSYVRQESEQDPKLPLLSVSLGCYTPGCFKL